jgi:hypothetical protein
MNGAYRRRLFGIESQPLAHHGKTVTPVLNGRGLACQLAQPFFTQRLQCGVVDTEPCTEGSTRIVLFRLRLTVSINSRISVFLKLALKLAANNDPE